MVAGGAEPRVQDAGVEVAPGLSLVRRSVPVAVDTFEGKKELVPVHPSAVQLNQHKGANVTGGLLAGPFYKAKMTTELAGVSARTALHSGSVMFFAPGPDESDPDAAGQPVMGWAIVHAAVVQDHRMLTTIKFTQLTGNAKRSDGQVEVTTEKLPRGWLKITPAAPLTPGEYALLPVPAQANVFSTSVYDFKVDPDAPNASDAVTAAPQ